MWRQYLYRSERINAFTANIGVFYNPKLIIKKYQQKNIQKKSFSTEPFSRNPDYYYINLSLKRTHIRRELIYESTTKSPVA